MEFVCDPDTLHPADTIHSVLKSSNNLDWANVIMQIVSAFAALHSKGILHCDIHTKNVFLHPVKNVSMHPYYSFLSFEWSLIEFRVTFLLHVDKEPMHNVPEIC